MDRKYLTPPFDMSEYIFGKRFVIGGVDFDLEDKATDEKARPDEEKGESGLPADGHSPTTRR